MLIFPKITTRKSLKHKVSEKVTNTSIILFDYCLIDSAAIQNPAPIEKRNLMKISIHATVNFSPLGDKIMVIWLILFGIHYKTPSIASSMCSFGDV